MPDDPQIPGSTIHNWMEFIEAKKGRAVLDQIMNGLEPDSLAAFSPQISRARSYPQPPFDDFCRGVFQCCGGYDFGISMGEHSAQNNEKILAPILRSAKKDPVFFLSERFMSIHRLYSDVGGWKFTLNKGNENGGVLTCGEFRHNAMSCFTNAGFVKKCLELLEVRSVHLGKVLHSEDVNAWCRMEISWG